MWNKHWVGIVYILTSNASTPYWFDTYGDRIYFYVYANLSTNTTLQNYIKNDFKIISKVFQFIVIVIPVPLNWNQFLENLKIINDIASKYNLKIL